tara:strand:+ start:1576 stop:1962 length:387 start_codon:yes stop_codon:yes gene_type:complete
MDYISRNYLKKKLYLILGLIFMSIGTIGIFVPILPTTIFMIIAGYFFLQSSDKLYNKVINNPLYGKSVKDYIEKNRIPKTAKYIILGSMWFGTTISIILFKPNIIILSLAFALTAIGTIVVLRANDQV